MEEKWEWFICNNEKTRYMISNYGRIYDSKKDFYTYGYLNRCGYMQWTFYLNNGIAISKLVHRLVAKLFVVNTNEEKYNVVDHINAIKTDNRSSNLRWCDNILNIKYAKEMGLMYTKTGEKSPHHKYTSKQICQVVHMLRLGEYTRKEIAKACNVNKHAVTDIAKRIIWKEFTKDYDLSYIDTHRVFSDEQIERVISLLDGKLTVLEIHEITKVSKSVIRGIANGKLYTNLTSGKKLKYRKLIKRNNISNIQLAISMLEEGIYTCKEIRKETKLSRSVIEKIAYHKTWKKLTEGKMLKFKNS